MHKITEQVLYRVRVTTSSPEVGERYSAWMLAEHGNDLLSVPGCIECRVFRQSPTRFEAHYLFESTAALQGYYEHHAPILRQKGSVHFTPGELQIERDEALLIAEGQNMSPVTD